MRRTNQKKHQDANRGHRAPWLYRTLDRLPDAVLSALAAFSHRIEVSAARLRRESRRAYLRRAVLFPEAAGDRLDVFHAELDALTLEELGA
jgi:hypothetical protein